MKKFASCFLFALLFSSMAYGEVVVATGSPDIMIPSSVKVCGFDSPTSCYQSVAIEFTTTHAVNINYIESYFLSSDAVSSLTLSLYSDVNNIPGQELYSSPLTVNGANGNRGSWSGLGGINWNVDAGKYWVEFEVKEGQNFNGFMFYNATGSNLPLMVKGTSSDWTKVSDTAALVILASIPEPETYAMLLAGLSVVGFMARKRSSKI